MKPSGPHPRSRVGVWPWGMALCISALLGGCRTPLQALQEQASRHQQRLEVIHTPTFPADGGLAFVSPVSSRIRVYLEGDGHAWATSRQPGLDPSPHDLMARLAFSDPVPSVYLARPCQFVSARACTPVMWTDRRFSSEVLSSLDQALDQIKARLGNQAFELVGYSGGAALALLLASQREDVAQVQTLAGNLSPRQWVALQQLSPLTGSLDPLDRRQRLTQIVQRHFVGSDDRIVPPQLSPVTVTPWALRAACKRLSYPAPVTAAAWSRPGAGGAINRLPASPEQQNAPTGDPARGGDAVCAVVVRRSSGAARDFKTSQMGLGRSE